MFKNVKEGHVEYLINTYCPNAEQKYFPQNFERMPIAAATMNINATGLFEGTLGDDTGIKPSRGYDGDTGIMLAGNGGENTGVTLSTGDGTGIKPVDVNSNDNTGIKAAK